MLALLAMHLPTHISSHSLPCVASPPLLLLLASCPFYRPSSASYHSLVCPSGYDCPSFRLSVIKPPFQFGSYQDGAPPSSARTLPRAP